VIWEKHEPTLEDLAGLLAQLSQAIWEAQQLLLGSDDMVAMHTSAILDGALKELPSAVLVSLEEQLGPITAKEQSP